MRNKLIMVDEDVLKISLASRGQLVNTLITLEPHGIFRSHIAKLILTLFCHWYAKRWRGTRLNEVPNVNLSLVGWSLMLVFGWTHHGIT